MYRNPVSSIGDLRADDLATVDDATAYVSDFYSLINREMAEAGFTSAERSLMEDPVLYYGRYLNSSTRPYFEETVIPVIGSAMVWLGAPRLNCVLDLGCGLAMQSIILAAMGKTVVAVDLRPESIELGKKRKRYYEEILGRDLAIEFVCGDFLALDATRYEGQIDGVFSMSAFSYIQPLEDTVDLISRMCTQDARVFLFEENSSNLIAKTFLRRAVPPPSVVADRFSQHGFQAHGLTGTCAVPKQLWIHPTANRVVRNIDRLLRKSMHLAFSYALMLER